MSSRSNSTLSKIGRPLAIIAPVVLTASLTGVSWSRQNTQSEEIKSFNEDHVSRLVKHSFPEVFATTAGTRSLSDVAGHLKQTLICEKFALAEKDPEQIKKHYEEFLDNKKEIGEHLQLAEKTLGHEIVKWDALRLVIDGWLNKVENVFAGLNNGEKQNKENEDEKQFEHASAFLDSIIVNCDNKLEQVRSDITKVGTESTKEAEEIAETTRTSSSYILALGTLAIGLSGLIIFLSHRRTMKALASAEQKRKEADKSAKKSSDLLEMILAKAKELNESATAMRNTGKELGEGASATSKSASLVSNATHSISQQAESLAAAIEEYSSSIADIAKNTNYVNDIGKKAGTLASGADERVRKLGIASEAIETMAKTISGIAEQTTLLALNATIESARAGEAGKGFAVVAAEVKTLASRVKEASETISKHSKTIRSDIEGAGGAMKEIVAVVNDISLSLSSVSSAITQQESTTKEISSNVQRVSQDVNSVDSTVASLSKQAESGTQMAHRVGKESERVSSMASELLSLKK